MTSHSSKNRPFDSWDALKLLALLLMFTDHAGAFFFLDEHWLRCIGRGTMPIFLFLGGFAASYRFKWTLFLLGALMTVSDSLLAGHLRTQNILFLILLCRAIFNRLERRGKKIERPWEWYAGCLSLFMSVFIVQYGCFGMLFAISGYLKRHSQYYPPKLPQRFLIASFIAYGCFTWLATMYPLPDMLLMAITLYGVYRLLSHLTIHEIRAENIPAPLLSAAKWISYYSGYIYAFHLIALEWMTGVPF